MPIIMRLDKIMTDRKMLLKDLADEIGISHVNLSRIKTGKGKAIRFTTLNSLCRVLNCQPGDLMEFVPDGNVSEGGPTPT